MKQQVLSAITIVSLILMSSLSSAVQVNLPDFTELVEQSAPSVVKISTISEKKVSNNGQTEDLPEMFRYFFGDQLPKD